MSHQIIFVAVGKILCRLMKWRQENELAVIEIIWHINDFLMSEAPLYQNILTHPFIW